MSRKKTVVVKFEEAIMVKGVETTEITLNRPKVKDMQRANKYSQDPSEQEIWLVSSLSGVPISDVEELDMADYESIQEELGKFRQSAQKSV